MLQTFTLEILRMLPYMMGLFGCFLHFLPPDPYHSVRVAEFQEAVQLFKGHMENASTWSVGIQLLTCRVDNVSSQIQMLGSDLESASADIQMLKGLLKDASTLSFQTQLLKSSLEETTSKIQKLQGDLEEANGSNAVWKTLASSSLC